MSLAPVIGEPRAPWGLPGATAATRYVGATAAGAPASGTFAVGDFSVDQTGEIWVCTVAGSPGTWSNATTTGGVSNASGTAIASGTGGVSGAITFATNNVVRASINFDGTSTIPLFGTDLAPRCWYDLDTVGGANGPNLAIGSNLPSLNFAGGGHGNLALGGGWRAGIPVGGQQGNGGALSTGYDNTLLGMGAGIQIDIGIGNTTVGPDALSSATSAQFNVAIGPQSLEGLTIAQDNIAIGAGAVNSNVTSNSDIGIGVNSLYAFLGASAIGIGTRAGASLVGVAGASSGVTFVGYQAGMNITNGFNTVFGDSALQGGTAGATNVTNHSAFGYQALKSITTGNADAAFGYNALGNATTAGGVTAVGANAGFGTTTGNNGTFVGYNAGRSIAASAGSVCIGYQAGYTSTTDHAYMTLIGAGTIGQGDGAVAIGVDHAGGAANGNGQDKFALGTANHTVNIIGNANIAGSGKTLGFYGVTAITQAVLATGASHTVDDVITALQNLGLVSQT